jgi:hypothetical protein
MKLARMRVVKSSFQSWFNLRGADSAMPLNEAGFEEGETVVVINRDEFLRLAKAATVEDMTGILLEWGEAFDKAAK